MGGGALVFRDTGAEDVAQGLPSPDPTIKVAKCVPGYGPEPGNKTLFRAGCFPGFTPRPRGTAAAPFASVSPNLSCPAADPGRMGDTAAGSPRYLPGARAASPSERNGERVGIPKKL